MKKSITISIILSLFLFTAACKKETLCTCTKTTTKWTNYDNNYISEAPVAISTSTIVEGDASTIEKACNESSVQAENNVTKRGSRMEGNQTIFYGVEGNEVKVDCSITKR